MTLSSMNSIGQTVFELESGNENVDKQTDGQAKNGQTNRRNFTNFESNLAMMVIYLPVKLNLIGQTVFEKMWTDRRTSDTTILRVTNPPKNYDAHLQPLRNVPTNYKLPTLYSFRDIAWTKF